MLAKIVRANLKAITGQFSGELAFLAEILGPGWSFREHNIEGHCRGLQGAVHNSLYFTFASHEHSCELYLSISEIQILPQSYNFLD